MPEEGLPVGSLAEWSFDATPPVSGVAPTSARARSLAAEGRLRAIQQTHVELLWRSLRRLGVPPADVDDAVQQVFLVVAQRLDQIAPGSERAFVFATALRVASHARRTLRRRRESGEEVPDRPDLGPNPEDLVDQHRARALLDRVLDELPLDLRAVLILFELEEMTVPQIAGILDLPLGTAASRLRRAREAFQEALERVRKRGERAGRR